MKCEQVLWDMLKEIDDVNDPGFHFLSGCLSYFLSNETLSDKQLPIVKKYVNKYAYLWFKGEKNADN